MTECGDEPLLRLGIIAADETIILAAPSERGVDIRAGQAAILSVTNEANGKRGVGRDKVFDDAGRTVGRAVIHHHDLIAVRKFAHGRGQGLERSRDVVFLVEARHDEADIGRILVRGSLSPGRRSRASDGNYVIRAGAEADVQGLGAEGKQKNVAEKSIEENLEPIPMRRGAVLRSKSEHAIRSERAYDIAEEARLPLLCDGCDGVHDAG